MNTYWFDYCNRIILLPLVRSGKTR